MKTKAFTLLITVASFTTAFADLVLINETAIGEVRSITKMSISGDKMRTDNGTETSVIMDAKSGDMITLMHEQKMMMKSNVNDLKAAAAALPKDTPGVTITEPKVTATGKKEKVQGYDCEIYTMEAMGTMTKLWVAKDYPGFEKLQKQLSVMEKLGTPGASKPPALPGMTLKTEFEQQGLKFVTSLVSLKEEAVDGSIFTVPAGYKPLGQ